MLLCPSCVCVGWMEPVLLCSLHTRAVFCPASSAHPHFKTLLEQMCPLGCLLSPVYIVYGNPEVRAQGAVRSLLESTSHSGVKAKLQ